MSTTWSVLPSQRPGIREELERHDPYVAWCLDECVLSLGNWVESELAKVPPGKTDQETANRRQMVLRRILGGKQLFADPLAVKAPISPEEA